MSRIAYFLRCTVVQENIKNERKMKDMPSKVLKICNGKRVNGNSYGRNLRQPRNNRKNVRLKLYCAKE